MELWIVFIVLVIVAGAYYFWSRQKGPASKVNRLWMECRRQLRMPPEEADKVIERYMSRLEEKHPDRSQEWYLEKILYDLERDRS